MSFMLKYVVLYYIITLLTSPLHQKLWIQPTGKELFTSVTSLTADIDPPQNQQSAVASHYVEESPLPRLCIYTITVWFIRSKPDHQAFLVRSCDCFPPPPSRAQDLCSLPQPFYLLKAPLRHLVPNQHLSRGLPLQTSILVTTCYATPNTATKIPAPSTPRSPTHSDSCGCLNDTCHEDFAPTAMGPHWRGGGWGWGPECQKPH